MHYSLYPNRVTLYRINSLVDPVPLPMKWYISMSSGYVSLRRLIQLESMADFPIPPSAANSIADLSPSATRINQAKFPIIPNQTDLDHDDLFKWNHFPCYWPFVRGIPLTMASDAELSCFLWSASEGTVEWAIETSVISNTIALTITLL